MNSLFCCAVFIHTLVWVMNMKKRKNSPVTTILLLLFFLGALAGSVVASAGTETVPAFIQAFSAQQSFWKCLWRAAQYSLLCGIFACSMLGAVLIPGLMLVRGYLFSLAAGLLMHGGGAQPELTAWIVCGLPAIVQLPGLLVLGRAGLYHSLVLCRKSMRRGVPKYQINYRQAVLFACISCLLTALCTAYLVPVLLAGLG